jgi:NADPH:quinone reductase-like Zn-dependent oxidoreductase
MPLSANLTIAITSGQGGTGFMGIQLAKALGAKHVVTAASGSGIAMVKALGADQVFDYTKVELFDALPDNSVDGTNPWPSLKTRQTLKRRQPAPLGHI